jgi:hypothetical protein
VTECIFLVGYPESYFSCSFPAGICSNANAGQSSSHLSSHQRKKNIVTSMGSGARCSLGSPKGTAANDTSPSSIASTRAKRNMFLSRKVSGPELTRSERLIRWKCVFIRSNFPLPFAFGHCWLASNLGRLPFESGWCSKVQRLQHFSFFLSRKVIVLDVVLLLFKSMMLACIWLLSVAI